MINRCKYLNIILHICGVTGFQCQYMADPPSCPNYGEDFNRSYVYTYKDKGPADVAGLESERIKNLETETNLEFVTRVEEHLRSIGMEVERIEKKVEEAPEWF